MTRKSGKLTWISTCLAVAIAICNTSYAEPYRYGNLEADVPSGWQAAHVNSPGMSLVTFSENKDNATTLFWLEVTPLEDVSPQQLILNIVEAIGAKSVERRRERSHPHRHQMTIDAMIDDEAVRATFNGFSKGAFQYVHGFAASPANFDRLQGVSLLQGTFKSDERFEASATEPSPPSPKTVLATVGTYRLTQQMINDILALAEFLAVQRFSAKDRRELRREIIDDFQTVTAEDISHFRAAGTLMRQVPTVRAIKQAQIRRDMISRFWFDAQKLQEASTLADLVFRYNPILGADEALGLVVPRSSLDALLASNSFVATKADLRPLTAEDRDDQAALIRASFGTLSEKQKRYLANGEVNWLKVVDAWRFWDEQAQSKHLRIVGAGGIKSYDQVGQVARNLEHWAGIDASSRAAMAMVAGTSNMMVLQHLRGTISSN